MSNFHNEILNKLKVKKHPFKTFLGRIEYGFDFLGYRLTPGSDMKVSVAWKTVSNHLERIVRLYEQGTDANRIGQYLRGWWKWLRSGVELNDAGLDMKNYWKMVENCFGADRQFMMGISELF